MNFENAKAEKEQDSTTIQAFAADINQRIIRTRSRISTIYL